MTNDHAVIRVIHLLDLHLGIPRQKKKRTDPLDMLIGTLLSQNTNDKNSHRAYLQLRKKFPTWKRVAEAPIGAIASAIKVGGMKNQKSRRIKALLLRVHNEYGSYHLKGIEKMKNDAVISMLTAFHGIGFKTAACVLLFSLRREVFPVDTHIHRICNRLGLVETKTPDQTFEAMKTIVPKGKSYSFHTNLIRFGRGICTAQRPRCLQCPLYDLCTFSDKEKFASQKATLSSRRDQNFMLLDEI
ncbi:MAG: endonuclease III [Bacteroidota bacterium]